MYSLVAGYTIIINRYKSVLPAYLSNTYPIFYILYILYYTIYYMLSIIK